MSAVAHHAEDVGKILMAVQSDLKALRADLNTVASQPADSADASRKMAALQQLVDKAESDIKLKTEAVLQTALNDQYTTLPAIREQKRTRTGQSGGSGQRAGSAGPRMTVKEQMQAKRQMDLLLQPTGDAARNFLQSRFGVTAPPQSGPKGATRQRGTVMKHKTAAAGPIVPGSVRNDPGAPPPRLAQKDVGRGMNELVNRGLIPKYVDLTPAFIQTPAPVLCGQVQMHPWSQQFVKQEPYTNPLGFNMSGVKMDLIGKAEPLDIHKREHTTASMRHAPASQGDPKAGMQGAGIEGVKSKSAMTLSVVRPGQGTLQGEEPGVEPEELPGSHAAKGHNDVGPARDYNALLDEFSLHQFIIRRGATLTTTPEFESFKRKHQTTWGSIQDIITGLERIMGRFNVPIAYVDGNKVALLSQLDYRQPTTDDLLDCLVNLDQVLELVNLPGRRYKGSDKEATAALSLQAVYRGHLCRQGFRNALFRFKAALVIQRIWKTILTCRATAATVQQIVENRRLKMDELSIRLKKQWGELKRRRRVVVHIPSLSREEAQRMSMSDFSMRQNAQLARLTWLEATDVEVLYVAPFPLSPDVLQYYTKLLQVRGDEHPNERFKIVFPENYDRFPSHLSLMTVLYYSPRCMARISNFCKGKDAYIIPGVVGPDDVKVACKLDLPLLAPHPQLAAVYGSKSGSKRIFSLAEVNTPPGAYDLYSESETLHSLARLVFERIDIQRWLLKIDDEFLGRGHAWLDVSHLQCHAALVRERERSMQIWMDPQKQQAAVNKVLEELVRVLPRKVEIAHSDLFPTWTAYLETFTRVGGVIEAVPPAHVDSPSVNLLIEPGGNITIHSTHDHIFSPEYTYVGASFPQVSANNKALVGAATAVAQICKDKGMVGYVSVDFVSFRDSQGGERLWAIDLNIGMHDTVVSFHLFKFITGGNFNPVLGTFHADVDGEAGLDDSGSASHSGAGSALSTSRSSNPGGGRNRGAKLGGGANGCTRCAMPCTTRTWPRCSITCSSTSAASRASTSTSRRKWGPPLYSSTRSRGG